MSRPTEASLSAGRAASQIAERVAHACARYSLPPLTRLLRLPFVPYSLPVCCCSRVHNGHAHLPSMRVYTSSQNSISSSRSLLFAPILSSPDHFTHVLPVDCAVYFFFILPSVSFFSLFFFLLSIENREPKVARQSRFHDSIGEMESGDRSPFSASHSLSRRHSKILVGEDRAGSSSRVYIYVYPSHEIRQGDARKNERSIGSRLTTGTTRTGFSSRTGGRRLFFLSLPLSHPPFKPPGPVRAAINKHGSPPRMASVSIRFPINPPPFHRSPPCSGQDSSVCSPPVVTRRCVTRHVRYIYI